MEAKVHNELSQFLNQHALEDSTSNIDEIVLSYLVGVVELVSQGDDATDFEDVLDMMNAYLPGFDKINRADVIDWMFGLADRLASQGEDVPGPCIDSCVESVACTDTRDDPPNEENLPQQQPFPQYDFFNSESELSQSSKNNSCDFHKIPLTNQNAERHEDKSKENNSQNKEIALKVEVTLPKDYGLNVLHRDCFQDKKNVKKRKGRQLSCSSQESQEDSVLIEEVDSPETEPHIRTLLEMFPSACTMEARHCLQLSGGDMDQAAQLIMDRQESGQAISAGSNLKTKKGNHKAKKISNFKLDDDSIKMSLLKKYSFVDTEEDKRTHRPPPPKGEAKKLVRYRDGQVVSMKGERFSEVKKNTNEMKS
ncbi:cue domain-containing protein 2 [Plakobranchus ocellatus]|uniref:Cue domain-containing protein 2 n=1 Tax=Plakobranchus ocellatus TaxID=259542 RepID=A0AAV4DH19_9GAST|nr:cue domain-containing protein 2 [Plakobranchus ocellatus]